MIAIAGSVLLASLLGSPRCAGVCALVCLYAGQGGRGQAWAHVAYNAGRLLSYLALGAFRPARSATRSTPPARAPVCTAPRP